MVWYEEDFYAWTQEQAAALLKAAQERLNLHPPLDYENLAEEIEGLGGRDRREVINRLVTLLEHLLKLPHSPAQDRRRGWRRIVQEQRSAIDLVLADSPSLRSRLPEFLSKAWPWARAAAIDILDEQDGIDAHALPDACLWTVEQVLDPDFWPEGRS